MRIDPTEHAAIAATDMVKVLDRRFPQIEIQGVPLCRFVDFATQLSGLPVSVSPEQLRMAGVGPAKKVSADLKDASLEEALITALEPLRLAPVRGDMQLMLQWTGGTGVREIRFSVDDLTSNELTAAELVEWLKQLTPVDVWKDHGMSIVANGDSIAIRQHESVQYDVLVLLEKLRSSQGLKPQSRYPASLIVAASPYVERAERMSGPATFTFSQYTPLRSIFRDWQEEMRAPVLVDWPALADAQLGPQTRIACSVADKPWNEALDSVLEPLGLAWRAVDGPAVQITSMANYLGDSQSQIYRLVDNSPVDVAQASKHVREFADDVATTSASNGAAVIAHPTASLLLIRQPAVVHRELVRWLGERNGLLADD